MFVFIVKYVLCILRYIVIIFCVNLKPLTNMSADQLLQLRTKVAVFKAIILTIEPQPVGLT